MINDYLKKNKAIISIDAATNRDLKKFARIDEAGNKECFKDTDEDIYLIFGAESTGIAYDILKDNLDDCYRIPTTDKIRSLNLSNCAAIMLFLASEQLNVNGEVIGHEPDTFKGEDFIDNVDINTLDYKHKEH